MGISLEKLLRQLGINPGDVQVDIPAGLTPFYGVPPSDTEGSQSFTVASNTPLDQRLSFVVGSCVVDNSSSNWLQIPDATKDGTGRFVPPGAGAAIPILGHISRGRVNWAAPPGKVQPPFVQGEQAVVIFFASAVPPGLGITSVVSTVSGPVQAVAAANVTGFGAKGDGQNDDTAAIIAADASLPAGGGLVFFPPGTYKITATIKPAADKTVWMGAGPGSVIAPTAAVTTAIDLTGRQMVTLRDLYITQPNNTSPFQAVLLGPGTFRCRLDHVFAFFAAPTAGQSAFAFTSSAVSGAFWNVLVECFANGAGIGYDLTNTGANGQNDNTFLGCRAQACNTGYALGGAAGLCIGNQILGGTCDGQNTWGFDFGAVAGGNVVRGVYLENSGATGGPIRFQAGSQDNDVDVIMNAALGHNAVTDNGSGNGVRSIISRPTAIETGIATSTVLPGHVGTSGAVAPTLGALQAGVSAQSLAAGSTDHAGVISITTAGAGPPGAGAAVAILNFGRNFAVAPVVIVSSANGAVQPMSVETTAPGTGTFTVVTNNALAINTTYKVHYLVVGQPN